MIARNLAQKIKLFQNIKVSQQIFKRHEAGITAPGNPGTSSYEGDGKTTATILNKDLENGLLINSISKVGFRLNNEMLVIGPIVIFPR